MSEGLREGGSHADTREIQPKVERIGGLSRAVPSLGLPESRALRLAESRPSGGACTTSLGR